jgi:FtsH-binding integral membrane protein
MNPKMRSYGVRRNFAMNEFNQHDYHVSGDKQTTRALLSQVFAWMAIAMSVSGFSAWFASSNPQILSMPMFVMLFFVQIGIVMLLGSNLVGLSYGSVKALFLIYSMVSGLTLSVIFLLYSMASIVQVFFAATGMFAAMAVYGWFTNADLSSWGSLLMMALWGIIISSLINLWIGNTFFDMVISVIGVIVFAALTAYDIQNIKRLGLALIERDEMWQKVTIMCALTLYLDFINIFLFLLQLFGDRKR